MQLLRDAVTALADEADNVDAADEAPSHAIVSGAALSALQQFSGAFAWDGDLARAVGVSLAALEVRGRSGLQL